MKMKFSLWGFFFIVSTLLLACTRKEDLWFEHIKNSIEKRARVDPDSIVSTYDEDSVRFDHYYVNGSEYKTKQFARNVFEYSRPYFLYIESEYNSDKTFELRKDRYGDGTLSSEYILYKGFRYGPVTSYHPSGILGGQGILYKDDVVGIYEKWGVDGTFLGKEDYKNEDKIDSILLIKFVE